MKKTLLNWIIPFAGAAIISYLIKQSDINYMPIYTGIIQIIIITIVNIRSLKIKWG